MLTLLHFDPHAVNPDNFKKAVRLQPDHSLPFMATIFPKWGPFFARDHVVRRSSNKQVLIENVDYYLTSHFNEMSHVTEQRVSASITIINRALFNDIEVDLRHLGGNYTMSTAEIVDFCTNRYLDVLTTDYENMTPVSLTVPAVDVQYNVTKWDGQDSLAKSIRDLATAIGNQDPTAGGLYTMALDRFNSILQRLTGTGYQAHIDLRHAGHSLTAEQVGALRLDATAKNAARIYDLTITELAAQVKQGGIPEGDIVNYLTRAAGGTMKGPLRLTDQNSNIQSQSGAAKLDLSNKVLTLLSAQPVTLEATTGWFVLRMGGKLLELTNSPTGKTSFRIDGKVIITAANLGDYIDLSPGPAYNVAVADTATVDLSGNGSVASPLSANLILRNATLSQSGLGKLINTDGSTSTELIPTPRVVKAVADKAAGYALKSYTVNGNPLTSNFTVDANDVSVRLERVNNTSEAEKPITAPMRELLAGYSPTNHTHDVGDFTVNKATNTVMGVSMFDNSPRSKSTTKGATQYALSVVKDAVDDGNELASRKLRRGLINLERWSVFENNASKAGGTNTSWIIGNQHLLYVQDTQYLLEPQTITYDHIPGWQNSTMFLFATPTGYVAGLEQTSDSQVHIQTAKIVNGVVVERLGGQVTDLNRYRTMTNHVKDLNAHGLGSLSLAKLGLGAMANYPLSQEVKRLTFEEVYATFNRFSHSGVVQPANPGELNTWLYDKVNDKIYNSTNSATVIGLYSSVEVGDYDFEVTLSSTDSDDDWIGLVAAFKVDANGVERTIVVTRCTSPTHPTDNFAVTYSLSVPGARTLARHSHIEPNTGWNATRGSRVRVERRGDIFKFWASPMDQEPIPANMTLALTIDLNSFPELSLFKGKNSYGYMSLSQGRSSFVNHITPEEDGSFKYVSAGALEQVLTGGVEVFHGRAAHGSIIPIPAGYRDSQLTIFSSMRLTTKPPAAGDKLVGFERRIDPATRAVHAISVYTTSGTVNDSIEYSIIARK